MKEVEDIELIEGKWYYFNVKGSTGVAIGKIEKLVYNETKVIIKWEPEHRRQIVTIQWVRDTYYLYNKS